MGVKKDTSWRQERNLADDQTKWVTNSEILRRNIGLTGDGPNYMAH